MKTILFFLFLVAITEPIVAQQPLRYTVWADGLVNPQLAKSSFYLLGTGLRAEVSRPVRHSPNAWFAQIGYAHFFQKPTSAFTASIGLVNIGYRYQSRKAFFASAGVGAQYWSERMRLRFPDYAIDETLNSLIPSAIVGFGFRLNQRTQLGIEYRGLFKPENGAVVLTNNVGLSVGYTL
ncbi:hypothetical protein [uncultured Fibrella sp.]|uniref:hypothetical protein n=1 Tax=uncultured Fibrella sp. TaxID=1284596 RepID=UPI0035CA8759